MRNGEMRFLAVTFFLVEIWQNTRLYHIYTCHFCKFWHQLYVCNSCSFELCQF